MTAQIEFATNPVWVQRVDGFFDFVELNKDGLLTITEILKWADNLEKACKATPKEIKALREALQQFWGALGLVAGAGLNKKQFLKGFENLAKEELKKKTDGQPTLHSKVNNAFFDVIDVNNDGTVTVDEVRKMLKACNYRDGAAEAWFNAADTNKDGRIDREELNKVEFDYWFRPETPNKGAFGGMFE